MTPVQATLASKQGLIGYYSSGSYAGSWRHFDCGFADNTRGYGLSLHLKLR